MNKDSNISEPDGGGVRYYEPPGGGAPYGGRPPGGEKSGSLKKPLIIFAGIILILIILSVSCNMMVKNTIGKGSLMGAGTGGQPVVSQENIRDPHVSVISVKGVITANPGGMFQQATYNHQFTLDSIDAAMDNDANKGILLFVDSPGGGVYESDELYMKIREYQKKTGRPVYSYMGSMAASGGYYISAPCEKIIANRNCWTGSIGVTIGTIYDISGLLEKHGIKTVTITSGANKAMGGMTEPMTEEQKEIFQSLVDEAYEQFVGIVAEGRGKTVDETKVLADGRIYTAKQAKQVGLVDEIATYDEALEMMRKNEKLKDVDFVELKPPKEDFFSSLLSQAAALRDTGNGDLRALMEIMDRQGEFPIMYMTDWAK